jgi:hypothetical protein
MEKSANKRWKESGSTLSFKEWIDKENKKSESMNDGTTFIPFDGDNNSRFTTDTSIFQDTLDRARRDVLVSGGLKDIETKGKLFGLDSKIVIFSSLIIVGSLGYYVYSKLKAKK